MFKTKQLTEAMATALVHLKHYNGNNRTVINGLKLLNGFKRQFSASTGWQDAPCTCHLFRPSSANKRLCFGKTAPIRVQTNQIWQSSIDSLQPLHPGSNLILNNGLQMPRFGLGVYKSSPGTETKQAVKWAIQKKYHLIDTAARYANEHDVGEVMKKENVPRNSLFIVTKVWDDMHGYESTILSLKSSLKHLGLEFVDMFLIHSPVGGKIVDTWKAMIHLMEQGYTRSIGVSNFGIHHLTALGKYSRIVPAVNQIEVHPFNQERAVVHYCQENDIRIMAYSPLTRGLKLDHPVVRYIANKHHKTPANVLIRWSLQKDLICIPKSVKERHIEENINVFDFQLDDEDIRYLDLLEENFRTGQDRLMEKWMP